MELKINNWSKELQKEIDAHKPKKGQPVKFRLLAGHPNFDPDPVMRENTPWLYPAGYTLRARDVIYDPGANDGNGDYIEIGVIAGMGRDSKTPEFNGYHLTDLGRDGFFYCSVEDQKSMLWFPFLWLTSQRKEAPNRNEAEAPVFEFVDVAKEARTRIEARDIKRRAHQLLSDMSLGKLKDIATMYPAVRIPTSVGDVENEKMILYDLMYDIVESDPEGFHAKATSPDLDKYVTIDKAIKAGLIAHQQETNSFIYTKDGSVIVALARSSGNPKDLLIEWMNTNDAGEQALQTIKALLHPAKPKGQTKGKDNTE